MIRKVAILLLLVSLLGIADEFGIGYVPNSATPLVSRNVHLLWMHLNNKRVGSSSVVVTIKDQSTNCSGGACTLWGPAAVGDSGTAGSVVNWDFKNIPAVGGVTWQADTASAVVGDIAWK